MPTLKQLYHGRAGTFWNVLCCPIFGTFGLVWRSIHTYVFPCVSILLQRILVGTCWRFFCCCFGWPYEDDSFYGAGALGNCGGQSAKSLQKQTDWIRAQDLKEFQGKKPQLFQGEIEPSDLCQGAVGDCWLVAAFACASEFPDTIRNMFLTKEWNPRGKYKIRIYDPQLKKWVVVTVDDRIPCEKGTNQPRFMKPNGNELWAILLEKAYAKYCGSYQALEGGFVLWGWASMTGDNVFQMSINKKTGKNWTREDMVARQNKKDKRDCGFKTTKEKYSNDEVWTLLKKYDKQKALISASIGKVEYRDNDGPAGEQLLEKEGLVAGHAYSVISAMEVSETLPGGLPKPGGESFKLLHIRNPWGSYEWKGKWSDKSNKWKKFPSIAKQCNFVNSDDGAFWMEYKDFRKIYTRLNICDRDTSKDASLDVREDNGVCGIVLGFCCGCSKFWCLCHGFRNMYFSHESTDTTLDTTEKCCWIC